MEGIELANGYHELMDVEEHRRRFLQDNAKRKALEYPLIPLDENFLAALDYGLPPCAGVALGIDRLIALALHAETIQDVLSFSWDHT